MKSLKLALIVVALFIVAPAISGAQTDDMSAANPPISQPLVREGTLALELADALKVGTTTNEAEAESMLGSVGIAPRNGWIADYPVTPDIIGELEQAVSDAADSKRLAMEKDEALNIFRDVIGKSNLSVTADNTGQAADNTYRDYPESTVINNYYYNEGPPVVTYYAPPPYYASFYSWVPYPFWWWDFWFPGFFILVDFHRSFIVDRHVVIISNHFRDFHSGRIFAVDPVRRAQGRTTAITGSRTFISSGVGKGVIGTRSVTTPSGNRTFVPSSRNVRSGQPAQNRTFVPSSRKVRSSEPRTFVSPSDRGRTFSPSVGRTLSQRSGSSSRVFSQPERIFSHPERTFRSSTAPSGGRTMFNAPSGSGRAFGQPESRTFRSSTAPSGGGRTFFTPSGGSRTGSSLGSSRGSFGGR